MYKTVRHGENSLQYTILPQQDDPSGSHGPRKRRHTRTATIVIVVLVLGCLVVTAAIVLPLLITANIIKLPVAFKKFSPFSSTDKDVHETRNYDRLVLPPRPDKGSNVSIGVTPQSTTVGLTTSNDNLNTLTTLPIAGNNLSNNKTGKLEDSVVTRLPSEDSTRRLSAIINGTSRNVVQQLMMTDSLTTERSPDIRPSTQATLAASRVFVDGGGFVATLADDPVRKNDAGDSMGILPARNGSSTRIIVEALMPSNADIRRSEPTSTSGSRVVVVGPQASRPTLQTKNQSWLQPRWPFADPSAYFQWTGYGGRDSLILPVILGGATLILLLSACACYAIRRRRQKAIRRQTIGKISSDLQAGDKANLLPDGSEEE